MVDLSEHDMPPTACTGIGIPRQNAFDAAAFERAVSDLLAACGIAPEMQHMGRTAERVRTLWQKRLLGGYDLDPAEALGEGFEDHRRDMVVVRERVVIHPPPPVIYAQRAYYGPPASVIGVDLPPLLLRLR